MFQEDKNTIMRKNKKGISILIGYVLLIVFAVIISAIVFTWLRSYVPAEALACDDGTSLSINSATLSSGVLNVTMRNNGRFSIAGYFIHASNSSGLEIDTIDLSGSLSSDSAGTIYGNSILFEGGVNSLAPGEEATHLFDISAGYGTLYKVSLTPTRFQDEDNRQRYVICADGKSRKDVL